MNSVKKLKLNTITSFFYQIVMVISGLILPRIILVYYGSGINGLVASISQFLSIITFLDLGIGSVVQSSLYAPLAKGDEEQVSLVIVSAKKYFRKIAIVLIMYVIVLIISYPSLVNQSLDGLSTAFLIFAMSISTFAQYYFGITNELLLNADQKAYIQLFSEIIVVVLNLIVSISLIIGGFSIQIVKLASSLVYLIRPIFLSYYVNKNYNIDYKVKVTGEPIQQKWNGMAQHIAYTVQDSTDIVVLSIFSTLENISIYTTYNRVILAIKMLLSSLTSGLKSFFGNLIANDEIKLLNNYFTNIEWLIHTVSTYLFGMTGALITSFVLIYTSGINDANYYRPMFSIILILAQLTYCIRTPYQSLILGAGHYKQTQTSSIIEAAINIILSIILIKPLGIIGVALGTLCSMVYRTLYLVKYLSNNIVYRPVNIFFKQILVDVLTFGIMIFISSFIDFSTAGIVNWVIEAFVLGILFLILVIGINLIFYRKNVILFYERVKR